MERNVFHGIGINKDGSLFCPNDVKELDECWNGINEIIDFIVKNVPQNSSNNTSYKEAELAIERFKSWNENINLQKKICIPYKILNDILKPAVDYVKNIECN